MCVVCSAVQDVGRPRLSRRHTIFVFERQQNVFFLFAHIIIVIIVAGWASAARIYICFS